MSNHSNPMQLGIEPSYLLVDALVAFKKAVAASPWTIEILVDRRGNAAVEHAAEVGIVEVLCELGRGDLVPAAWAAYQQPGNPARATYLLLLRRLANQNALTD